MWLSNNVFCMVVVCDSHAGLQHCDKKAILLSSWIYAMRDVVCLVYPMIVDIPPCKAPFKCVLPAGCLSFLRTTL